MDRLDEHSDTLRLVDLARGEAHLDSAIGEAIAQVARQRQFILGPEVEAFESELAAAVGVTHVVGVSSGTDALEACLRAAGITAGDEVVLPALSFFATAEVVLRLGARPRFVDVAPGSAQASPDALAAAVGPRSRAVVAVHLFGDCADLAPLRAWLAAQWPDVTLVEDAAQAVGATVQDKTRTNLRAAGSQGHLAATSFFPGKTLGCWGDGGAVLTSNPALAAEVRRLRNHGASSPGVHPALGGNWRLDTIQAAVLRVKLPYLAGWASARRALAARYDALFAEAELPLTLPHRAAGEGHAFNRYVVLAARRDALRAHLQASHIESAIYYPRPLPHQPALAGYGHRLGDFPNAEAFCQGSLALPLWVGMSDQEQRRVVVTIADFYRGQA